MSFNTEISSLPATAVGYIHSIEFPSRSTHSKYSPVTWVRWVVNYIRIKCGYEDWNTQEIQKIINKSKEIFNNLEETLTKHYLKDIYLNFTAASEALVHKSSLQEQLYPTLKQTREALQFKIFNISIQPSWEKCVEYDLLTKEMCSKLEDQLTKIREEAENGNSKAIKCLEASKKYQEEEVVDNFNSLNKSLKILEQQSANDYEFYAQSLIPIHFKKYQGLSFELEGNKNASFQLGLYWLNQGDLERASQCILEAIEKTNLTDSSTIQMIQKPSHIEDRTFNAWFKNLEKLMKANIRHKMTKREENLNTFMHRFPFLYNS